MGEGLNFDDASMPIVGSITRGERQGRLGVVGGELGVNFTFQIWERMAVRVAVVRHAGTREHELMTGIFS